MNNFEQLDRHQFLVEFAYQGQDFFGVQEQVGLNTVLGMLRKRIEQASGQRARCLFVAARTDKGVHALHNCATFYLKPPMDICQFTKTITTDRADGLLDVTIREVDRRVHARAGKGKIYRYMLIDGVEPSEHIFHQGAWE